MEVYDTDRGVMDDEGDGISGLFLYNFLMLH